MDRQEFIDQAASILTEMQDGMLERAKTFRDENVTFVADVNAFKKHFRKKGNPGFVWTFAEDTDSYEPLLKDLKVTARCMPLDRSEESGDCIFTGSANARATVFARAY